MKTFLRLSAVVELCLAAACTPLPLQAETAATDEIPALDERLENLTYPHPVQCWSFKAQGKALEMAYMDVQPQQRNGVTVMLLHGKNFSGSYWEQTIQRLVKEGYRVVVPDQIGFGKSTKPDAFQYTFQQLATQTQGLLQQLKIDRVVVLGHSMGGMLATRFALMFPQHTSALVLENPIGLEDWKLSVPYRSVDEWYQGELKQTRQKMREYQETSYYHGTWKPEYDRWLNQAYGWVKSPDYPRIAWNSALTYDMIFTQPVVYEFSQVQSPVLLIIGQLDRTALGKDRATDEAKKKLGNYPQLGQQAAAAFPHAKLVALEGVGHIPHIEQPESFYSALLPFLSSLPKQP